MIKIKVFTAISLWLLLATMVLGCGGSPALIRTVVSETLVAQVVDELPKYPSIAYSPDGRRVAYIAERGGKKYVIVDGVPVGKGYDAIGTTISNSLGLGGFSPDSQRVAYIGITYGERPPAGNKSYAVIDGEEGDAYTSGAGDAHSSVTAVTFSPDSKHVAYNADGLVFLDRVRVSPEGTVRSNPLFSPDSQHLAYIIERSGGGKFVVRDGVPVGRPYGMLGTMAFSPDSQHLAYRAMIGNRRWVMVVDGREESQYESSEWHLDDIVFSPDSKHLAYIAGDYRGSEHSQFVVLDGKELMRHKDSVSWGIVFSPDGNHLAYGSNSFIVVDGVERAVRSSMSHNGFVFSPDSTRHAYKDIETRFWSDNYTAAWVVVDGVKGKKYRDVGGITFSPDSKHVAYNAYQGKKAFVIVDETRKEYDRLGRIVWDSADRFHYLAWKGNSIYLVEETLTQN